MGFNSKYNGTTVENLLDKIPKNNTIIHSGNIGDYALKFYPYDWTSNDYNANVSEKNDEYIERKRMLEEYFASQDGKDIKVKRTKTRGKHF